MDPRLKIAVVATNSWYLWNFRKETLVALRDAGHEVLCVCGNADYTDRLAGLGVAVLNVDFGPRRVKLGALWRTQKILRSILDDFQPDAVLSFTLLANVHVGLSGERSARWIAVIAGQGALVEYGAMKRFATLGLLRWSLARASKVVFRNSADCTAWTQARVVDQARTHLISGSGVDLDAWSPAPIASGPLEIVCHARLLRSKGIGHFLTLARQAKLIGLNARFQLAGFAIPEGQGGYPMSDIRAADERGEITFHGALDDVSPLFQGPTVGCLLSEYGEGKPRSLIEALAVGRPILMSEIAGCADLIENSNGYAVDLTKPSWTQDALEHLTRLDADRALYASMAAKSRTLAEMRFDVRDNIRTLQSLLEGE